MHRSSAPLAVALSSSFFLRPRPRPRTEHVHRAPETIAANDNRRSAGTLKNGVLTVQLEARAGKWYPEGDQGIGRRDRPRGRKSDDRCRILGPLIRAPSAPWFARASTMPSRNR
jgi:hypothetical protein